MVALIASLMEEPPAELIVKQPEGGVPPSYEAYAVVYRAHWVFTSSSFSMQLLAAMVALKDEYRQAITQLLLQFNSRDSMNLEAFTRFLNTFMDQYSPEMLLAFFEPADQLAFIETLLVLVVYEPIRDVLIRICNETADTREALQPLMGLILSQLSPRAGHWTEFVSDTVRGRIANDQLHQAFSRMVFTCDLLTDLIHEHRTGSLGFFLVQTLANNERYCNALLDAVVFDLSHLPSDYANESYSVKVLNSLLQQSQCGCVAKAVFFANQVAENGTANDPTRESPHADLPLLWKLFLGRLPMVLEFLKMPPATHFKSVHMQLVYLILPVLNVACSVADRAVIDAKTMEVLLDLMVRFPQANILHCAVSRLFIVALEDSPFMFGKELPAYRAANDPLRLHLLLNGAFERVISVFGDGARPPPAFLDVAISFDQAVTNAHAFSATLFDPSDIFQRWQHFRSTVLLPTQAIWEEQYQPATSAAAHETSPRGPELHESAKAIAASPSPVDAPTKSDVAAATLAPQREEPIVQATSTGEDPPDVSEPAPVSTGPPVAAASNASTQLAPSVEDVPTPLSALYNDEEKSLMLKVASTEELPQSTAI